MKAIILTAAIAVLGLVSCKKEVIEPVVLTQTELIQGQWNNNTITLVEPTAISEPEAWPSVTVCNDQWIVDGVAREFSIANDVISWDGAESNDLIALTSLSIVLTDTLANGNVLVLLMNR